MENTKSLNRKFKMKQLKAVLRLVVLVFTMIALLVGVAWSWYADNDELTASGISMTMQTADFLAVSIDGGDTFHSSINILNDPMFENLNLKDITSNGISFYVPKFSGDIGELTIDRNSTWSKATPNTDYISLSLTFRSSFVADVYVASGTQVITKCETEKADGVISPSVLLGPDTYNKSAYGDFSKDGIVGAIRMSALNSNNISQFVWIPRPDVMLTTIDLETYDFVVGTDATSAVNAQNLSVTGTHFYYDANRNYTYLPTALSSASAFTADVGTPGAAITKITSTSSQTDDGYYTGTATVNVWLEGCDNEARRALSDGELNIFLNFVAVPIE